MISVFLRGVFRIEFPRYSLAERGMSSFELASSVFGMNPGCDLVGAPTLP